MDRVDLLRELEVPFRQSTQAEGGEALRDLVGREDLPSHRTTHARRDRGKRRRAAGSLTLFKVNCPDRHTEGAHGPPRTMTTRVCATMSVAHAMSSPTWRAKLPYEE